MKSIRVVLTVPNHSINLSAWEGKVAKFIKTVDADLAVFPEGYRKVQEIEKASYVAKDLAKKVGCSTLVGVSSKGYTMAAFWNPAPKPGETKKHLYIKHATSTKLAYEWATYKGKRDLMFDPIILRGNKFGVMICHDMFFPLITNTLVNHGADCLIDLTYGNVILQKWTNIVQARSIEMKGVFLCTMGNKQKERGKSTCIAYQNGRKMQFLLPSKYGITRSFDSPEPPGFAAITIPCRNTIPRDDEQPFTNSIYSNIAISFRRDRKADFEIRRFGKNIVVSKSGQKLHPDPDGWIRIRKKAGIVGLLALPIKSILDRSILLKKIPTYETDYHLVLYYGEGSHFLRKSDLLALARLRAIENRVGVLILTNRMREAIKRNDHKNIQRFKEKNGVFGLDLRNLGGPKSVFTSSDKGIPRKFMKSYLKLL